MNEARQIARPRSRGAARGAGAVGRAGRRSPAAPTRRRLRSSRGSASTWRSGPCASTPIRWRTASGSTCSVRAKGPTAGTASPAAAAAAIESGGGDRVARRALALAGDVARVAAAGPSRRRAPTTASPCAAPTTASRRRASSSRWSRSPRTAARASTSRAHYLRRRHHLGLGGGRDRPATRSSPRCATRSGLVGSAGTATGAVTLGYKYSAESDYWSHGGLRLRGATASGATARLSAVGGGVSWDGAWPRARTPNCATADRADLPVCGQLLRARWPSTRRSGAPGS